jgi:hypothetical protein
MASAAPRRGGAIPPEAVPGPGDDRAQHRHLESVERLLAHAERAFPQHREEPWALQIPTSGGMVAEVPAAIALLRAELAYDRADADGVAAFAENLTPLDAAQRSEASDQVPWQSRRQIGHRRSRRPALTEPQAPYGSNLTFNPLPHHAVICSTPAASSSPRLSCSTGGRSDPQPVVVRVTEFDLTCPGSLFNGHAELRCDGLDVIETQIDEGVRTGVTSVLGEKQPQSATGYRYERRETRLEAVFPLLDEAQSFVPSNGVGGVADAKDRDDILVHSLI